MVEAIHKVLLSKEYEKKILKRKKCKNKQSSATSNVAWSNLSSKSDTLELFDICPNPEFEGQKQVAFTPKPSHVEQAEFKNKSQRSFIGTQTA